MRAFWHHDTNEELPEVCDAIVIGAGITGLSAAKALADAGVETLLLERGEVGAGASTRNAGYLMRGAADNYSACAEQLGRDRARELWRATEDNLAMLRALGVECVTSYTRCPSTLCAHDEGEAHDLRRSIYLMREDGFTVETLETGDDALWTNLPPMTALVNPDDATINPADLITWFRTLVTAPIHEHTPVHAIDAAGDRSIVRTNRGDIRAKRVLVCTNAWAARLAAVEVVPNRGQMCALRVPAGVRLDHAYYLHRGSEYIRQAGSDTVVVGGWRKHFAADERTDAAEVSPAVQGGLEDFAASVLGGRYPVLRRWAGTMGFTRTGLPIAGPVGGSEHADRLWVCAGFTGHGMSLAHITATQTALAMLGGGAVPSWCSSPAEPDTAG